MGTKMLSEEELAKKGSCRHADKWAPAAQIDGSLAMADRLSADQTLISSISRDTSRRFLDGTRSRTAHI